LIISFAIVSLGLFILSILISFLISRWIASKEILKDEETLLHSNLLAVGALLIAALLFLTSDYQSLSLAFVQNSPQNLTTLNSTINSCFSNHKNYNITENSLARFNSSFLGQVAQVCAIKSSIQLTNATGIFIIGIVIALLVSIFSRILITIAIRRNRILLWFPLIFTILFVGLFMVALIVYFTLLG